MRTTSRPHEPMPRLLDLLVYLSTLRDTWVLLDIKVSMTLPSNLAWPRTASADNPFLAPKSARCGAGRHSCCHTRGTAGGLDGTGSSRVLERESNFHLAAPFAQGGSGYIDVQGILWLLASWHAVLRA